MEVTDDVVAELDWLASLFTDGNQPHSYPYAHDVIQRARDEIVGLRDMREAHIRMLSANNRKARAEALEEAATACLRKARDHVIPIGQDNYHDGCVSCAAAIRALKDRP